MLLAGLFENGKLRNSRLLKYGIRRSRYQVDSRCHVLVDTAAIKGRRRRLAETRSVIGNVGCTALSFLTDVRTGGTTRRLELNPTVCTPRSRRKARLPLLRCHCCGSEPIEQVTINGAG